MGLVREELRSARQRRGLSQSAVGKDLGVSAAFIARVEGGRAPLPKQRLAAWATAVELDAAKMSLKYAQELGYSTVQKLLSEETIPLVSEGLALCGTNYGLQLDKGPFELALMLTTDFLSPRFQAGDCFLLVAVEHSFRKQLGVVLTKERFFAGYVQVGSTKLTVHPYSVDHDTIRLKLKDIVAQYTVAAVAHKETMQYWRQRRRNAQPP